MSHISHKASAYCRDIGLHYSVSCSCYFVRSLLRLYKHSIVSHDDDSESLYRHLVSSGFLAETSISSCGCRLIDIKQSKA